MYTFLSFIILENIGCIPSEKYDMTFAGRIYSFKLYCIIHFDSNELSSQNFIIYMYTCKQGNVDSSYFSTYVMSYQSLLDCVQYVISSVHE